LDLKAMASVKAIRVAGFDQIIDDQYCYYKAQGRHEGPIDTWYLSIPGVGIAKLASHKVAENADGTITVTPSILVTSTDARRTPKQISAHGYLTAGEWRNC
jgi:hypothetical protein